MLLKYYINYFIFIVLLVDNVSRNDLIMIVFCFILVGIVLKVLENLCEVIIVSFELVILKCVFDFGELVVEVKWFKGLKEIKKS